MDLICAQQPLVLVSTVFFLGRVARAGRIGKAISLLSSDELPYLADLFLFLGRPLKFALPETKYDGEHFVIFAFSCRNSHLLEFFFS